jgi:DNA ligase-1
MPSYEAILNHALVLPLATMADHVHLTAGVPVKPMLAKPTKGIAQVLERFGSGTFTCEFKYDGERAQIHWTADGVCKVFSRNSEDMTGKYPDILARMPAALAAETRSFIIDCEAVAYDPVADKLLPFQKLSTRAKKDVAAENIVVQVKVFAFDILYLNGQSLLKRSLGERRKALHAAFVPVAGEFDFATAKDSDSAEEIGDFLTDAVAANCEGLMVKTLDVDATYEPTKRSFNWLKVKKDYIDGMGDSLDLVPIGAYHGRGKRTGVYGAFLLACYDEEREEFQCICKIGTGFSEEDLKRWAAFFKEEADGARILDAPRAYYRYPKKPDLMPDVWFEPSVVRARPPVRRPFPASSGAPRPALARRAPSARCPPRARRGRPQRGSRGGRPTPADQPPRTRRARPRPSVRASRPRPLRARPRPGLGGARRRPLDLAAVLRGRRRGARVERHRAPLPALHPRARRQEARGRDQRDAGRANVPRAV